MTAAIETRGLTRDFNGLRALDNLDLVVEEGEIFGFLGANGAGKSTTIRLLLDFIRPTLGSASILGMDCQSRGVELRRHVGFLAGDVRLPEHFTGRELARLFCRLRGIDDAASGVEDIAERLDFDLDRRFSELSKGNRQKAGLAIALLGTPRVLLLDEPSGGLDPLVQHRLWDLLRERAARGVTVFFSSHVLSEVELVCERVAILRAGKLMDVEPVSNMKARGLRHIVVRFANTAPAASAFDVPGVREVRREHSLVEFEVRGEVDALLKRLAGYHVLDFESEQPTLEEILMAYYEREPAR